MTKKIISMILGVTMLLCFVVNTTVLADAAQDLDLSFLSEIEENESQIEEKYAYEWTVEEVDEEIVRTLTLTLDGANIQTLTLPCRTVGEIHIIIDTESDSYIEEIAESHVFSYSYQWNSITFKGAGNLEIENMNIQGGGNDHIITVSGGASVNISGEYADLGFGASGNNGSTLCVYGMLSVEGDISCGNVKIGEEGTLKCKRVKVAGYGAFDTDRYNNAFVLQNGGKLDAIGNTDWQDDESGEYYGALVVSAQIEEGEEQNVIVLPDGYLPDGYSIKRTEYYVAVDNDDENQPEGTSMDYGVIYAATSLKLGYGAEKYDIVFENYDGSILQSEQLEAGVMPEYKGETPQRESDDEFTYTFEGWTPEVEEVTEDKTYTATYTQAPNAGEMHTVVFETNGGSGIDEVTVADGEKLERPKNPTRSGYRFKGWFENERLTEEYDFDKSVTSSFTLYAKWQKKQSTGGGGGGGVSYYTVKFETNGGSEIADKRVAPNSKLKKPDDPVKNGYVLEGWYVDEQLQTAYDFDNAVTKGMTLYAKWREATVSDILNVSEHFAYIKGYHDNTIRPESNITRAETTEIFFRLLAEDVRSANTSYKNGFADVDENAWYNTSVSTMAKLKIVDGREDNLFHPDAFITRGEFAAICARFDNSGFDVTTVFSDISGHWAEDEILEAAAHGWIKGYEDGTFHPDEFITRAEAISLINRMTGRTPASVEDLKDNMIRWADNSDEKAWYYVAIQEATNDHAYVKSNAGQEKWQNK